MNLTARLSLDSSRFTRGMREAQRNMSSMSSGASSLTSQIGKITASFGAATLAVKTLKTTFAGAMQMETDKLTLGALVNDAEKANKLFDMLQQKGLKSVFSDADFMGAGKAFLPITKDLGQINKLLGITERLASSNPLEGMSGAAFSIREALSGDLVSLQDRFNIPRSTLKQAFKGADTATEKIKALDHVLNGLGFTQQFVNKVNTSASAQWQTLKSNVTTALAKMGGAALEKLKKPLTELNNWIQGGGLNGLKEIGSNFLAGAVTKAVEFGNYIKTNWPAIKQNFAELSTALSPLKTALEVILTGAKNLVSLMASDWKQTVDIALALSGAIATLRIGFAALAIVNAITASIRAFQLANQGATVAQWALNVAMSANPIGLVIVAIAALVAAGIYLARNWQSVKAKMSAVWDGIKSAAATAVNFMIGAINKLIGLINKIPGVQIPIIPKVNWGAAKAPKSYGESGGSAGRLRANSHHGGLNRVPYDGYMARLHKDETVLNRGEAEAYRNGRGMPTVQFGDIHLHGVGGDLDKAADKLMNIMARRIKAAGGDGA